jgi:hypothetical protein
VRIPFIELIGPPRAGARQPVSSEAVALSELTLVNFRDSPYTEAAISRKSWPTRTQSGLSRTWRG